MKKSLLSALLVSTVAFSTAQAIEVEEIINGYIENTGGAEAWNNLKGLKMTGEVNQGGMKFPFEVVNLSDGRQYIKYSFQGKELKQNVFDGKTMWSNNFMTMKAEKSDAETTANQMLESNDFPNPFLNYKENGYGLELMGTETMDGTEAYKVKLTKEPITVDGKQVENISYHYFDTEAMVPLSVQAEVQQGPGKGKISESKLGDYQEVDGLYFAYSMTQGLEGMPGVSMSITKVELNPEVTNADFDMPVETETKPAEKAEADKKAK